MLVRFGGVTSDKVALALQKLKENDIPLVQESEGSYYCKHKGFEARARLEGDKLTLELLKKPWWAPQGKIKDRVVELLKEEGIYELV